MRGMYHSFGLSYNAYKGLSRWGDPCADYKLLFWLLSDIIQKTSKGDNLDIAIIIGNVCTLFAMLFNSLSATRRTPKGILWMQNVSQGIYLLCGVVLKGYSASVQNAVSILRNIAAIRKIKSKTLEWVFVALGVVLGIVFNNRSWIGLLPVIGNLQYTLAVFRFQNDERKLKLFFLISIAAFIGFNFAIQNYVGVAADSIVMITTVIALLKTSKNVQTNA